MKKIISSAFAILLLSLLINVQASSVNNFMDVRPESWYYNSVKFVTDNNMFKGTSSTTFSPDSTMTRAMFVTVLGRYAGVTDQVISENDGIICKSDVRMRDNPSTKSGFSVVLGIYPKNTHVTIIENVPDIYDPQYTWYHVTVNGKTGYIRDDLMRPNKIEFTDVVPNSWYSSYVLWAYQNGIAEPTSETTFSPEANITREEICSMLYNFCSYKHYSTAPKINKVYFNDSYSFSAKYATAISTIQQLGVINGYPDGTFKPKNYANRSEVAAMLMRFLDATSYKPIVENSYDQNGSYIYGTQVPQSSPATMNHFDNACFIGHSLVVGMKNYFNLSNADFYAINGATTNTILNNTEFELPNGDVDEEGEPLTGTLDEALSTKQYSKVYIMLGINEARNTISARQNYYNNMLRIVSLVRGAQPNVPIYLVSLTPVSEQCSDGSVNFNRDNIINYNKTLKTVCLDTYTYYLNVFDLFADQNGYLPANKCFTDGLHLNGPQYTEMLNYFLSHTHP